MNCKTVIKQIICKKQSQYIKKCGYMFIYSCYMNSVIQVLYSLPEFKQRYNKICSKVVHNLCFYFVS